MRALHAPLFQLLLFATCCSSPPIDDCDWHCEFDRWQSEIRDICQWADGKTSRELTEKYRMGFHVAADAGVIPGLFPDVSGDMAIAIIDRRACNHVCPIDISDHPTSSEVHCLDAGTEDAQRRDVSGEFYCAWNNRDNYETWACDNCTAGAETCCMGQIVFYDAPYKVRTRPKICHFKGQPKVDVAWCDVTIRRRDATIRKVLGYGTTIDPGCGEM